MGATVLGTILSSDKTCITAMTGNREAHPLLISLANLGMEFRMKSSNHAFLLLALLPIPHFIHPKKRMKGLLSDRVFHECMDFVTQPLKTAARIGIMMSDPLGGQRFCFTPLAGYIVDTPESTLIAGVGGGGKTSSVTMASYEQFGDPFRHEPRSASTTLAQLKSMEDQGFDPWDLPRYFKEAQKHRLGGIHRPFWRDWPLSDPSVFLTPEPLHHWHKQFFDHDVKWCVNALGGPEIDFRFSVLHPHTSYRHFKDGISTLKQVTGREQRDIQRYLIPIIAGAVPKNFLIAIRALMDFRYLGQAPEISEHTSQDIKSALAEFHAHKQAILDANARINDKKIPINNWHIPKLEFMQSVVPSIFLNGVPIQWTADHTENAHITEVKTPARSGNNQNYEPQICRFLDRIEKCRLFNLSTAVLDAKIDFRSLFSDNEDTEHVGDNLEDNMEVQNVPVVNTSSLLEKINPVASLTGTTRHLTNFFSEADTLRSEEELAPKTFSVSRVAFHLRRDPMYKKMTIEDAQDLFQLPDLMSAIQTYVHKVNTREISDTRVPSVGGRRITSQETRLPPLCYLQVWTRFQIQTKSYFYPYDIIPPQTINAAPKNKDWPLGRYDAAIVNLDSTQTWPYSGLKGVY